MHEDIKNFDSLLYGADSLKRRHNQILHHHLEVLDAIAEPDTDGTDTQTH